MAKKTNEEIIKLTERHVAGTYKRHPIVLVRGKGVKVWDRAGKEYLDFVGGLATDNLGHCHPAVTAAVTKQAKQLLHVSNLYHIEPQALLARELTRRCFADKVFFCNSGTEANEAAIKLTRRFFYDKGQPERYEIITMENSFHGRTYGGLSATGQTKFQTGFAPLLPGFKHVPFNDLPALAAAIGPQTAAILVEPIQGEGGVIAANKDYLAGARKLCDERGLLLIFDEVQTGFGRTGKMFAYELYGVKPDIITLAKALGGGVAIGAMAATDAVMKSFVPGTHAATFGGNPLACAAALAALGVLTRKGFIDKARRTGAYFKKRLEAAAKQLPVVKEVRGAGLILAMELTQPAGDVVAECMQRGFLLNCTQANVLRFVPPLIVTNKEIDRLIPVLTEAIGNLRP